MAEIARAGLQTPLRVRIAVGIVAARHEPRRYLAVFHREFWEQMPGEQLDTLVVYAVLFMFSIPPLVFLILMAIARP
jgi:hypothetical protein